MRLEPFTAIPVAFPSDIVFVPPKELSVVEVLEIANELRDIGELYPFYFVQKCRNLA